MKLICSKCGETAISKCPACRTIFPRNQINTMAQMRYTINELNRKMSITVDLFDGDSIEDAFRDLACFCRDMLLVEEGKMPQENPRYSLPTITKFLCNHEWEPADKDQHSDIGCGHY